MGLLVKTPFQAVPGGKETPGKQPFLFCACGEYGVWPPLFLEEP